MDEVQHMTNYLGTSHGPQRSEKKFIINTDN